MKEYRYPRGLKASPKLGLWNIRDVVKIGIFLLLSVLLWVNTGIVFPLALTAVYAFLSIRLNDSSVADYLRKGFRFFVFSTQYYIWKRD